MKKLAHKMHKIIIYSLFIGVILGVFLSSQAAYAAIGFDASASNGGNNVTSVTIASFTVGTQSDRIMFVQATLKAGQSVTGVTWKGVGGFTQLHTVNDGTTKIELWYKVAPDSGTGDVVVTVDAETLLIIGVATFYGVDQTSPIDSNGTNTGSGTSITVSATVVASNCWGVGTARTDGNVAFTEGGDQTALWDFAAVGHKGHGSRDETVGTGSQSMSWTIGSAAWTASVAFLKEAPLVPTTTLGDGTDPGDSTVAPGSSDQYLDQFTFVTNTSTDSVTALTVTTSSTTVIASMEIWNDALTTQYFSTVSDPGGDDTWDFSGGTPIPVSTTTASFRVIFTAKGHASLAAGTYAVTGTVTAFTCTNSQAGTDTDSATITVDNAPPADATWGTITPGDTQIVLNWTNPGDEVLILRKADSEVTDAPTEGTEYSAGNSIGVSTVCYVGSGTTFTDTGLTNGTTYYYKIFAYDTYINYAVGVSTGPHIPSAAPEWWKSDWLYRNKITFDNSDQEEDLLDFPVLVRLSTSSFDFSLSSSTGADIRFIDADNLTKLSYEFEVWDSSEAIIWVKVPEIKGLSKEDFIYMYYGNDSASSAECSTGVWTNGYEAVWHFKEETGNYTDSTGNGHNSSEVDTTNHVISRTATGQMGNCPQFAGADVDAPPDDVPITIPSSAAFTFGTENFSLCFWVKATELGDDFRDGTTYDNYTGIVQCQNNSDGNWEMRVYDELNEEGKVAPHITGTKYSPYSTSRLWPDPKWHQIDLVRDKTTNLKLYFDGKPEVTSYANPGDITSTADLTIGGGGGSDAKIDRHYKGYLDEMRISTVARSADWIAAQYKTMTSTFTAIAEAEVVQDPPPGNVQISAVYKSSITMSWDKQGGPDSFVMQASTVSVCDPVYKSSATANTAVTSLTVLGLDPNTTYYLRVGSLYSGTTEWASTLSTSTLADEVSNAQIYKVFSSSVTLTWDALPQAPSTSTCEGYIVQASTKSIFDPIYKSSSTTEYNVSTLTVTGLESETTYWFRVGALNWSNAANYVVVGSTKTKTLGNVPPGNVQISEVYKSSITMSWDKQGEPDSFVMQASTVSDCDPVYKSSATANTAVTSLTVLGLDSNTTYYLRVGSLYSGTTEWISTPYPSTSTLANQVTNAQIYKVFESSVTLTWDAHPPTPSSSTCEGYIVQASTSDDFIPIEKSSSTTQYSVSTLTVVGLESDTTYWFRVGALNWSNAANYVVVGSTKTLKEGWGAWLYRNKLTFNNSLQSEDLTNFPVLVKLTSSTFDFSLARNYGEDIRFVDEDNKTELSYEIEKWDSPTEEAIIWVKVLQIDRESDTDFIYMYYGNDSASSAECSTGVWTNGYEAVWHFEETEDDYLDSTKNGHDSISIDDTYVISRTATGQIGNCPQFCGENLLDTSPILIPESAAWIFGTNDFSLCFWVKATELGDDVDGTDDNYTGIMQCQYNVPTAGNWEMRVYDDGTVAPHIEGHEYANDGKSSPLWPDPEWHQIDLVRHSLTDLKLYFDSTNEQTYTYNSGDIDPRTDLTIGGGGGGDAVIDRHYKGLLDEFRISTVARSADWIAAQYLSMGGTFVKIIGPPPQNPQIIAVCVSSITMSWTEQSIPDGYVLEASTKSDCDPVYKSSATANTAVTSLTVLDLDPNTTYYLRVGSLYSGTTEWISTPYPSTSTLANQVTNAQIYKVFPTSVTLTWDAHPPTPSSSTCEGYIVQASTSDDFIPICNSSSTTQYSVSTLTVIGLSGETTYWFRVGALNWSNAANYVVVGSTKTLKENWWNGSWLYRKKLLFDNSDQKSEDLVDFPVLVRLSASNFNFSLSSSTGADIRFIDADNSTELKYEIEKWDSTNEVAIIWVKVPQIDRESDTDFIYMYYGNSSATDNQDKENVWTNNYRLVLHLAETTDKYLDSSGFNNHSDAEIVASRTATKFGNCAQLDGTGDYISVPNPEDNSLNFGDSEFTIMLWHSPAVIGQDGFVLMKGAQGVEGRRYDLHCLTDNRMKFTIDDDNPDTGKENIFATEHYAAGNWYFHVGVRDTDCIRLYINGYPDPATPEPIPTSYGNIDDASKPLTIGIDSTDLSGNDFEGYVEEIRVSIGARSADWIAAQYKSMCGTFVGIDTLPNPPEDLTQKRSDNQQTISWGAVTNSTTPVLGFTLSDPNTEDQVKFNIQVSSHSNFSYCYINTTSTLMEQGTTGYTCTELADTTWYWRVKCTDEGGLQSSYVTANSGNYAFIVNTTGNLPPCGVEIDAVYLSSVTVSWHKQGEPDGFVVEASTESSCEPVYKSSSTSDNNDTSLTVMALDPNTTYYLRVGSLYSGTTEWISTPYPSTSTLANQVTNAQIYEVFKSSVTLTWDAHPQTPSSSTCEGYIVQVSTSDDFIPICKSSSTTQYSVSTLTVTGLSVETTYWFRVGAYNWSNVANYSSVGSTTTLSGAPPPSNWTAYNDCGDEQLEVYSSTTNYVSNISGEDATPAGNLVAFSNNAETGVYLTLSSIGTMYEGGGCDTEHGNPSYPPSGDAATEFDSIINMGKITYTIAGVGLTITLTGVSSDEKYTLVVLGLRGRDDNVDYRRWSRYTISNVSSFTNSSSTGIPEADRTGDSTTYMAGWNWNNGYVAKWTNIVPTSDTITLTVTGVDHNGDLANKAYLSAIKLVEEPPEQTSVSNYTEGSPPVPPSYVYTQSTGNCLGTFKFDGSGTVSKITITQYSTCDANNDLENVKLFKDDGNGNWELDYDITQLGSTTTFSGSSSTATFSDFSLVACSTCYVHVILDVKSTASHNKTIGIEISQAFDVTSTNGVTASSWAVQLGTSTIKDAILPEAVTTLSALTGNNQGEIELSWTSPGDDGWDNDFDSGSKFDIRYSTTASESPAISTTTFSTCPLVSEFSPIPTPVTALEEYSMTVTGLTPGVTYYFAMKTRDEVPNWSDLSNGATAMAKPVVYAVWDGGAVENNNWSMPANWSGDVVPGETDDVLFNDTSNKPCTIDISTTVASFSVQAGSTITITAEKNLTVTGDFRLSTGTFNAGSTLLTIGGNWSVAENATFNCVTSTVTFNGSGSFNILSSGTTFYSLVFNNSVSTWTLTDALYASGDFTLTNSENVDSNDKDITIAGDFTIDVDGGKFTAGSSTITVSGNWDSSGGTFNYGTSTVVLTGTGTLTTPGLLWAAYFYNLKAAAAEKTTTLQSYIGVANTFILSTGTFTDNTGTSYHVTLMKNGGTPFVNSGATITLERLLYRPTSGIVTVTGGDYGTLNYLELAANGSDITFNLGGDITVNGTFILVAAAPATNPVCNTQNYDITANGLQFGGFGAIAPTTLNCGSSTIDIGTNGLTVGNNAGLHTLNLSSATITCAGNWKLVDGDGSITQNPGISSVTLDGSSGTQNVISNNQRFYNLTINNAGASALLEDDLDVDGDLTISAGTLDTKSGENNPINVAGNWTYEGDAFECRQSTVTFDNASSTSTLTGSTTFYGLVSTANEKLVKFSSDTVTYVTGYLNFGNITLRSTLQGATWYLNLPGSATQDVSGVDVRDSNALKGQKIIAFTSFDSGNNTNWDFGPPEAITDLTGFCVSATGDVTLSWSTPGDDYNWQNTLPDGSMYIIDYATYTVQWSTENYKVDISTSGVAPHTEVSYTITGLTGDSTWYFVIWTRDEVPTNWSGLSNGATVWVNPILSVSISTNTYDFGDVPLGQSTHTVSIITVTNDGNIKETYSLKISSVTLYDNSPSLWKSTDTTTGHNRFIFYAIFHGVQVSTSNFDSDDYVIDENRTSTADWFSDNDGGGDKQTGINVPKGDDRKLWFRLDMPTSTNTGKKEKIKFTITAGTAGPE